ncbi:MAG: glycosyltransferase [Niastella sp.]|nr:glycosyltransferase [Niastella sp.]
MTNPGNKPGNEREVIFFTHTAPLPPIGGGTRSFYTLKSLAQQRKLTLVVFTSLKENELALLQPVCDKILCIDDVHPLKNNSAENKIKTAFKFVMPFLMSSYELNGRLLYFLRNPAHTFSIFNNVFFFWLFLWFKFRKTYPAEVYQATKSMDALNNEINELLKPKGKLLFFDFNYFLPAVSKRFDFTGHTIICNSQNVEYDIFKQSLQIETKFTNRAWLKAQYRSMREAEMTSLTLCSKVFCCSKKDKETYQLLQKGAAVFVVPNGVDSHYFTPAFNEDSTMSLLFTGTMNYFPNQQAVAWFITKIFPLILTKHPQLIFTIAGKHADKLMLDAHPNIRVVANPEDMRPYFRAASIYIVPLQLGGGTRLKILEAAAMGLPVVSTHRGAEGLENLDSSNILLADDEQEFARAIQVLIENKEMRESLASNLNAWVNEWYSWEKICSNMNEIVFN